MQLYRSYTNYYSSCIWIVIYIKYINEIVLFLKFKSLLNVMLRVFQFWYVRYWECYRWRPEEVGRFGQWPFYQHAEVLLPHLSTGIRGKRERHCGGNWEKCRYITEKVMFECIAFKFWHFIKNCRGSLYLWKENFIWSNLKQEVKNTIYCNR